MTTTKHEGKYFTCNGINKNNSHAEPTGAGMRERLKLILGDLEVADSFIPNKETVYLDCLETAFNAELSRLHSRIVEDVEKEKLKGAHIDPTETWTNIYGFNVGLDKALEKINLAFKDL